MAKSDEIQVTPEMRAAGWAKVNRDLIDGRDWALDDLYRAMRTLEPEPGDELKPNQFLLKYRPMEKIE